ncbi:AMP-dependent synthetase/ligase [Pseudonocardia alaniniphila]|uniref:Acyl-CoA synthetase n=1 Tax=Pseudonocardia alaniniphila TaxID=75291 RepID=A0ABS9TTW7_9PSEU|nr:AMP-dependent synthetase/ligase [Pseudonocardia alaniniphila]MCH6171666.1 AMP-dependent synthetase/ligase [Pseudonocardia alaniniphila]
METTSSQSICALLERQARQRPQAPAVSELHDGELRTTTWADYHQYVLDTAAAFLDLGLQARETVAILAGNRIEHLVADLATAHCGAVSVTLYPTLSAEQLAHVASDAEPRIIVVDGPASLARITELPWVEQNRPVLVTLDVDGEPTHGELHWQKLTAAGAGHREQHDATLRSRQAAIRAHDAVTYVYTSGTTGPSKGAVLTHGSMRWMAGAIERAGLTDYEYRGISYLPLAHVAERLWSIYLPLQTGGHVLCCPAPERLAEYLHVFRPSFFMAVPRVWEKLLQGAERLLASPAFSSRGDELARDRDTLLREWAQRYDDMPVPAALRMQAAEAREGVLRDVRAALGLDRTLVPASGAAPIGDDVRGFFASLGVEIIQGYGLTETSGVVACERLGTASRGSVGLPLPGAEIHIADDGEILVSSPGNTPGYRNRPDANAELFDARGWLHTGDIGRVDEAGRLHITDRKKDIIITAAGKNISPTAIEFRVAGQSFIDQVLTFGDTRPYVVALLTAPPENLLEFARDQGISGTDPDELVHHPAVLAKAQRVVDEANSHLSRPEQIKRFRLLATTWTVESGELTPTFKLRRAVIHRRHADDLAALYAQRDQ